MSVDKISVRKNRTKDASKSHTDGHTDLRGSLDLEVYPRITPIPLCSKAKDENTRYNFLAAMLGLHNSTW